MSEQMFQVVETYEGVTRVKMVGSYKKCKARAKQLKISKKKKYHNYKCEVIPSESNEKFNTRTPGIWNEWQNPRPLDANY